MSKRPNYHDSVRRTYICVLVSFFALVALRNLISPGFVREALFYINVVFFVALVYPFFRHFRAGWISQQYQVGKILRMPQLATYAKLTHKSIVMDEHSTSCLLTFQLRNHTKKGFEVSAEIADTLSEGEAGILVYKDDGKTSMFLSFHRQERI